MLRTPPPVENVCKQVAVETSRRRTFILMKPSNFLICHPIPTTSAPSGLPRLFFKKIASTSSLSGSMDGTGLVLSMDIRVKKGCKTDWLRMHVGMSSPRADCSCSKLLPALSRSRISSHSSHSEAMFSTGKSSFGCGGRPVDFFFSAMLPRLSQMAAKRYVSLPPPNATRAGHFEHVAGAIHDVDGKEAGGAGGSHRAPMGKPLKRPCGIWSYWVSVWH